MNISNNNNNNNNNTEKCNGKYSVMKTTVMKQCLFTDSTILPGQNITRKKKGETEMQR
jgi:hypothetical protein